MSEKDDSVTIGSGEYAVWRSQELLAEIAPIIEEELRVQGIGPDDPEYAARYRTARACMERLMTKAMSMREPVNDNTSLEEETQQ